MSDKKYEFRTGFDNKFDGKKQYDKEKTNSYFIFINSGIHLFVVLIKANKQILNTHILLHINI